ncbi:ABC transporter substrate-binding protein [Alsobacter soli]|nr:ABC transporter substrate-binding protein [Alsobacter soli]
MNEHKLSRRTALKLGAGAAALAGLPWMNSAALAADELRAGIAGFNVINTLDPARASLVPEFYVIYGAFNGLLKFNEKMEIVPDLAESYATVDPTTVEFKLRKGVKFHDGNEMTAEDVKFSIERVMDEKLASPNRGKVTAIASVTAVDPYTVRITTKTPYAPLLNYLTNTRTGTQIVSKKAVEAAGEGFGRKPVGTGAFMVKDWKSNESVDMVAFDDYFGGKPKIRSVKIPIIAEESSGMTAILGGQVDLTSTAPFADVPALEKRTSEVKVLKQPGLNTRYFALNVTKAPFDDVHFRRAVSMAFDRNVLVKAAIFGEGVAIPGVLPPSLWPEGKGFHSDYTSFNPQKAKQELAKSKYGPGTEATVIVWGSNWWRRTGEIMVGMVNQTLGTKFQLQAMEFNAAFAKAKAGDYQALVFGWLGLVDPDEYLGEILGSTGFRNIQGYSSPKMDDLLEKARAEMDPAKRRQIYREADLLAVEDMPVLPCFCSNVHNLLRPNVQGFNQLPYSNFADQFAHMTVG